MTVQTEVVEFVGGWASTLMAEEDDVVLRPMFGCPGFFFGPRMFACIHKERLVLKLPAADVSALIESGRAGHFGPSGRPPMRQWCALFPDGWREPEMAHLLRSALAWAKGGHRAS
jgi:hypothetical protein